MPFSTFHHLLRAVAAAIAPAHVWLRQEAFGGAANPEAGPRFSLLLRPAGLTPLATSEGAGRRMPQRSAACVIIPFAGEKIL